MLTDMRQETMPTTKQLKEVFNLRMKDTSEEHRKMLKPQNRNFVCCGLMGWDLIRLVMPMAGIELQIAADVHSYPLPHDAA